MIKLAFVVSIVAFAFSAVIISIIEFVGKGNTKRRIKKINSLKRLDKIKVDFNGKIVDALFVEKVDEKHLNVKIWNWIDHRMNNEIIDIEDFRRKVN